MLKLIAAVIVGVTLGILTTAAFACNDASVYTPPPPQVQAPATDGQG